MPYNELLRILLIGTYNSLMEMKSCYSELNLKDVCITLHKQDDKAAIDLFLGEGISEDFVYELLSDDDTHRYFAVTLKYLSKFERPLEILLYETKNKK